MKGDDVLVFNLIKDKFAADEKLLDIDVEFLISNLERYEKPEVKFGGWLTKITPKEGKNGNSLEVTVSTQFGAELLGKVGRLFSNYISVIFVPKPEPKTSSDGEPDKEDDDDDEGQQELPFGGPTAEPVEEGNPMTESDKTTTTGPCQKCGGTGYSGDAEDTCETCGGTGVVRYQNSADNFETCPDCNGKGGVLDGEGYMAPCLKCRGTGKVSKTVF